jgi:putative colanic acid biosynthesis acetyltransferase WcaF
MNKASSTIYARGRGESPWSLGERIKLLLWEYCWAGFCRWTPKPLWPWRNQFLKLFGATIGHGVFVHQRARIQMPWRVILHDRACIGDRANLYCLDEIIIGEGATIAQEAYLCTGTHDFENPALPLVTRPILVEAHAFVGARSFVMPGVTIGEKAVVGACAVVTKNVPPGSICAGNPARNIQRNADSEPTAI